MFSFFSNSVLQGESVQNSTYNIPPRASDTEIPKKPFDVYAKIVKVPISLCLKLAQLKYDLFLLLLFLH